MLFTETMSSLTHLIVIILTGRPQKEVVRVHARRVIAPVAHYHAIGDVATVVDV